MMREAVASDKRVIAREEVGPVEPSVFDHIRVICRYRRMIVITVGLAVVTTATVCLLWPPSYEATASVVPPLELLDGNSSLGAGLFGGGEAALLRKVIDVASVADIYASILNSRAVMDALVDRFDLMTVYETGRSKHKARKKLQASTRIDVSEEGIVYIAVEDDDPNRAAAIANTYVEELDEQNQRLSAGQATNKRLFLENRLKEIEGKFSRIDTIPSHEAQVQEMLYGLLMRELELAKIEEAKSIPTIQVLDPATPPERRKPRGTMGKTALAGVVSFLLVVFIAFGRDHFQACHRSGPDSLLFERVTDKPVTGTRNQCNSDEQSALGREGPTASENHRSEAVESTVRQ